MTLQYAAAASTPSTLPSWLVLVLTGLIAAILTQFGNWWVQSRRLKVEAQATKQAKILDAAAKFITSTNTFFLSAVDRSKPSDADMQLALAELQIIADRDLSLLAQDTMMAASFFSNIDRSDEGTTELETSTLGYYFGLRESFMNMCRAMNKLPVLTDHFVGMPKPPELAKGGHWLGFAGSYEPTRSTPPKPSEAADTAPQTEPVRSGDK